MRQAINKKLTIVIDDQRDLDTPPRLWIRERYIYRQEYNWFWFCLDEIVGYSHPMNIPDWLEVAKSNPQTFKIEWMEVREENE